MTKEKIIITGANGFIGSELAKYFSKKKFQVVALVRNIPVKQDENIVYVKYDLTGALDENIFINACYLVHCAFIKNEISANVEGAKKLIEASRKFQLKKNIFISSFSAALNSPSKYGRQKFETEKLFDSEKDVVIRAGVVLGNGGLFKQMSEHIRSGKPIPLINGGKQPVQTIYIDDLMGIIEKVISGNFSGSFNVAEKQPASYREFFRAVAETHSLKPKFIHVPFIVLNLLISGAEFLKIPLPISKENLLGLKSMKAVETESDLKKIGVNVSDYKESLRKIRQNHH